MKATVFHLYPKTLKRHAEEITELLEPNRHFVGLAACVIDTGRFDGAIALTVTQSDVFPEMHQMKRVILLLSTPAELEQNLNVFFERIHAGQRVLCMHQLAYGGHIFFIAVVTC